jgi:lipopolysaccharide export system permease protein
MIAGTLSRYFGLRFLRAVTGSFVGVVALAAMIDYVELLRRSSDWPHATAWIIAEISAFRVPQLSERIMPFAVLVGAMSCYLTLSRRLEMAVCGARADRGVPVRHGRDHALQSGRSTPARTLEAA